MRWFCVAFGTLVVVSTALSRAGAPVGDSEVKPLSMPVAVVSIESTSALPFEVADLSNARRMNQGASWSAALFLGLPFLIRRRRERLS